MPMPVASAPAGLAGLPGSGTVVVPVESLTPRAAPGTVVNDPREMDMLRSQVSGLQREVFLLREQLAQREGSLPSPRQAVLTPRLRSQQLPPQEPTMVQHRQPQVSKHAPQLPPQPSYALGAGMHASGPSSWGTTSFGSPAAPAALPPGACDQAPGPGQPSPPRPNEVQQHAQEALERIRQLFADSPSRRAAQANGLLPSQQPGFGDSRDQGTSLTDGTTTASGSSDYGGGGRWSARQPGAIKSSTSFGQFGGQVLGSGGGLGPSPGFAEGPSPGVVAPAEPLQQGWSPAVASSGGCGGGGSAPLGGFAGGLGGRLSSAGGCGEAEVVLNRSVGSGEFGFLVLSDQHSLVITGILEDGHLERWNRCNPLQEVRKGDRVVRVNGVAGDIDAMKQQLLAAEEVRMQVIRVGDGHAANITLA